MIHILYSYTTSCSKEHFHGDVTKIIQGIKAKSTPEVFTWGHSVYGSIFRGKNTLKVTKTGQFCISVKSTNSPWFVWPIMLHHMLTWHPFYFKSEFLVEKIKNKKKSPSSPQNTPLSRSLLMVVRALLPTVKGREEWIVLAAEVENSLSNHHQEIKI